MSHLRFAVDIVLFAENEEENKKHFMWIRKRVHKNRYEIVP